ncbi:MAG: urea ABC transporter ATP-binding protein UrtD [Acidimicrobiales bacterium]
MGALLQVSGVAVSFDGAPALAGVELAVDEGEVRFLIGPNGAGKTTLIDVITGLTQPSAGSVIFGGRALVGLREHDIVRLGVGRTFQTPSVFERLSVLENLDLAHTHRLGLRSMLRRRRGVASEVAEALEAVQLAGRAGDPAGELSHGQKQWLEIGMLLVQQPRLLLFDEPVAGMSAEERTATGALIETIAERCTIVIVEHDMEFLRRFARRVTVMHEGRVLSEGSVEQVRADPIVQEVYLGRSRDRRGHREAEDEPQVQAAP